jgi:hypothetical protein
MMSASVSESSADVGSSRMRMGESLRMARAMVRRCFSPFRHRDALFPDDGVVAVGEPRDHVVEAGETGGRHDLVMPGV